MKRILALIITALLTLPTLTSESLAANPRVKLTTNFGPIELELLPEKAPETVKNFLRYVQEGHYNGTMFHRVISGFMIQGGGFTPDFRQKPTHAPIRNEATNGLKNTVGTIAMARTGDPHSATAQFFINTVDNVPLDHREQSQRGWGYTVFGKVVDGMDVVKSIERVRTQSVGPYGDVPDREVLIEKAEVLP